MNKVWAVIPAAGQGSRFKSSTPKQFLNLHGKSILEHSVHSVLSHPDVDCCIIAISPGDKRIGQSYYQQDKEVRYVSGGRERSDSVLKALQSIPANIDWVLVHDAARPCVSAKDITSLLNSRQQFPSGAILAAPVRDTMKRSNDNYVSKTISRDNLWHALTPQLFQLEQLKSAMSYCEKHDIVVTDEASAIEATGNKVGIVEGSNRNIKITWPEDLELAGWILEQQKCE